MADILIRGMEMPETCHECPLNVGVYTYDGGDNKCALDAWDGYFEQPKITRHPDCPLVSLPEGHGRMIDGTDLYAVLDGGFDVDLDELPETKDALLSMIQSAPTIVPAEGGGERIRCVKENDAKRDKLCDMEMRTIYPQTAEGGITMLRPGDVVVMNDKYYVSPENKEREWKVRSKPWVVCGQEIVLLEGKTGGYATDGLSLISRLPEPPKEVQDGN